LYILAFALQLRKRHGKPSVRVAGEGQLGKKHGAKNIKKNCGKLSFGVL